MRSTTSSILWSICPNCRNCAIKSKNTRLLGPFPLPVFSILDNGQLSWGLLCQGSRLPWNSRLSLPRFLIDSPIPYCLALQHTQSDPVKCVVTRFNIYKGGPCVDHSISPRPSFTFSRRNFLVIIVRHTHNIDRTFLRTFQSKHPTSGCALFHDWSYRIHPITFWNLSRLFAICSLL